VVEEFHEWRSLTSRIISRRVTSEVIERCIRIVRRQCLLPFQNSVAPDNVDFDVTELESIIKSALELASNMAKQRASLKFKFFDQGATPHVKYNTDVMCSPFDLKSIDEKRETRIVILTLAPGLFKYGTSEGTNFETGIPIVKTEVETGILKAVS
jgi:hypothetical protein